MSINEQQIAEKLQLLEQRMSKNGQATIQRSFQQQQNFVEQQMDTVKKEQAAEGNFSYNGGNGQQGRNYTTQRNQENDEDNDSINNGRQYTAQYNQQDYNIPQVMHRVDDLTEQPEFLEQDEDEILNQKIQQNNQIMISFEEKNEQNIWNKDHNSSFEGEENYGEDSNYFLAPQEKLSNNSSISNQEAREMQGQPQYQHLLKVPDQKQQNLQGQQDLSDRHQQQQMFQQGIATNQSTGGGSSIGQQGNNYNNILMQNSREKNQKSTAKKRKTTQTTLPMNKAKKFDGIVPSIVQNQIQNQITNRPRINSESSNSNEALQLSTVPPAGNAKITEFFKKKNPSASSTPSINNNPQIPQVQQVNQVQQAINNGQNYNNSEENNIQVISAATMSVANGQSYQNSNAPSITNQSVTSKKNNNRNTLMVEENKTLVQNGQTNIQNNSSQLNSNMNSGAQLGNNSNTHQYQSTLKVSSSNQMMIVDPKLELKYNSLQEDLKSKEQELNDKNSMLKYLEHDKKEIEKAYQTLDKNFSSYKQKVQKIVQQQLLENEKLKREEMRLFIQKEKQRLGEYIQTRDCTKFDETWQQGTEFVRVKDRLKQIELEKEELEKKKKNIKGSRKSTNEPDISQDLDMQEAKQRINLQYNFLQKEENDLVEAYKILEHEKFLFVQKLKRFQDEQKFGQSWVCLGERFQLLSLLGRGGFSEVYKAYDLHEFKEVACKIHQLNLNWSEQSKANYIKHAVRESKIHSELKHPNIVMLFDTVEIDNNSFATILEYCEGPDLYFYLKKHKILPEKDAKMLIKQILCALKYMNSQKTRVIHYDLKPQNIIFHKGELKISDFGLSKIFEDGQTRMELTSQGVGTYWYLPPETFEFEKNPQISPKVDIWSVGVIFFEMVFGQRPFGNNKSQDQILKENIILKSTQVNFPPKPNVSNECKEFIRNCLTYDQNRRWDIQKAWDSPYMNAKTR